MRIHSKAIALAAAVTLFSGSQAYADNFGRGLSINPGGGFYAFDKELNIDDNSHPNC